MAKAKGRGVELSAILTIVFRSAILVRFPGAILRAVGNGFLERYSQDKPHADLPLTAVLQIYGGGLAINLVFWGAIFAMVPKVSVWLCDGGTRLAVGGKFETWVQVLLQCFGIYLVVASLASIGGSYIDFTKIAGQGSQGEMVLGATISYTLVTAGSGLCLMVFPKPIGAFLAKRRVSR